MTRGPRGKRHLVIGILLLIAGAFFIFGGLSIDERSQGNARSIPSLGEGYAGHTPRGFSAAGDGIFLGDDINDTFPTNDGVWAFVRFELPPIGDLDIQSVTLHSNHANVMGTPFADLGAVVVEHVSYDEFSQRVWDTESLGELCRVAGLETGIFHCDVTQEAARSLRSGERHISFRLRFERASDNDGEPDILYFSQGGINEVTPGLFSLRINHEDDLEAPPPIDTAITVPVVVHRVVAPEAYATAVSEAQALAALEEAAAAWKELNIEVVSDLRTRELSSDMTQAIESSGVGSFSSFARDEEALAWHIVMVGGDGSQTALFPLTAVFEGSEAFSGVELARAYGQLLGLSSEEAADLLDEEGALSVTDEQLIQLRRAAAAFEAEVQEREELFAL